MRLRCDRPEASTIANVVRKLEEHGALANTIVVVAPSESAALQFALAPLRRLQWVNTSVTAAVKTH